MKTWISILFLCFNLCICAQENPNQQDSSTVFTLGEVVVRGINNKEINAKVDAAQMRVFAKYDVAKALDLLPGVNQSAVGPRNESMVFVRGFDLRQVPLLIDGIPVYIPYDGYVDLGRFTTFDLSEISVSKGYTSMMYGPNALGGAINLISRRPVKKFEFNGATGWLSGGYRSNINIGTNLGKFYIQAGASIVKRDSFPLSNQFKKAKTEEGGWRNNSYTSDEKYNIKIAYTPNQRSEYALSYVYQHGKKGTPPYAGTDTLNSQYKNPRFWQWPYWNKQSLYFISNTVIDSNQYIRTRFYYDQFKNQLNSYDDASYTSITKPYAFKSFYNDYSFGGIVEYGRSITRDNIKATIQYKQDIHRENNEGEPVRNMTDRTITAGLENEFLITPTLSFLTGLSFNNRSSIEAQNYNSSTKQITDFPSNQNNAFNIQGGLVYQITPTQRINFSVAKKTRFATIKDRYSYRLGTAIPNPDLKSEDALNFDLSYSGKIDNRWNLHGSLFYSKINNTIMMISNVYYDSIRKVWQSQLQNAGESEFMGMEAGAEFQIIKRLKAGANYTFIKRNNLTNPSIYFTDVPEHKFFAFAQFDLPGKFYIQVNTLYNSSRYSTSYGTQTGSYMLLNTTAYFHIWRWFSVEGGINNITDRNYSLVEGYPEPGRNYFLNFVYRL